MKFEQALQAMREGKTCKIWERMYALRECKDYLDRDFEFIYRNTDYVTWDVGYPSEEEILAEDWEVVSDD